MSLIRKHGAVLQAWACLDLVNDAKTRGFLNPQVQCEGFGCENKLFNEAVNQNIEHKLTVQNKDGDSNYRDIFTLRHGYLSSYPG